LEFNVYIREGLDHPKRLVFAYNIISLTKTSTYIGGLVTSEQQRGRKPRGVYQYWLFFTPKIDNHAKAT
jgi:hypothetical protein